MPHTIREEPDPPEDTKRATSPRVPWEGVLPEPKKYLGFLYLITNKETGRKYLGRKQYWITRKGKRIKESDWRTYTGSSPDLNRDIKNIGLGKFKFEILAQVNSKGSLRYLEANIQHKKDILLDPLNWYNKHIDDVYSPSAREHDELTKLVRKI
jgi:hypothetical protein